MKKCIKCDKEHNGSFGSGKYCSRRCANSRTFSEEAKTKKSIANKNNVPWNKGKKFKQTLEKTICCHCGLEIEHYKSKPRKYHAECWLKESGGQRKGSGRGKSGWYNGYWCDSSYELAWVIYQIEHNILFERNKDSFEYVWEGKKRKYFPDFIQDNIFIEIKGFVTEQTKAKFESVPNLKILTKKDLEKEFHYVENKYGKDFIKLYENSPYENKKNKCKVCAAPAKNIFCSRKCSGSGNNRNSKIKNLDKIDTI
jgi:hypothetical protein